MGLAALTFTLVSTLPAAGAQYLKDSAKFTQAMTVGDGVLAEQIQSHEDLVEDFFPGRSFEDLSVYVYDPPPVVDYSVGMIVEPCSNAMLEADCCVGLYVKLLLLLLLLLLPILPTPVPYPPAATATATATTTELLLLPNSPRLSRYGAGEYGVLQVELEDYRQRPKNVLADSSEILANTLPVTEQGVELPIEESRRADDELYIDSECTGVGAPHPYCRGYRMAMRSFYEQAACTDHNMTVNAGKDCTDIFGNTKPNCMQVAYTQTGFIMVRGEGAAARSRTRTRTPPAVLQQQLLLLSYARPATPTPTLAHSSLSQVCGDSEDETDTFSDDDHCGTYLEIHRANGSPYDPEEKVLGDAKIDDRDATGYNTTTMDLFYEDEGRVLCAYDENEIRVDSMVFVLESSPTCCCPMVFQATSGTGHFMCPQNLYKKDHGPFGEKIDTCVALLVVLVVLLSLLLLVLLSLLLLVLLSLLLLLLLPPLRLLLVLVRPAADDLTPPPPLSSSSSSSFSPGTRSAWPTTKTSTPTPTARGFRRTRTLWHAAGT